MPDRWIVATSMGFRPGKRTPLEPGPVFDLLFSLAQRPSQPKLCYVGTAWGDDRHISARVVEAFQGSGVEVSTLALFPMPNVEDLTAHLCAQDVVWVGGGSVAGLLAMWRLHGLDEAMRSAWEAGVVLAGVSAGSICWHLGGPTDSFGPTLRPITNGLGLLPYGNGVHYDGEAQRRPLLHRLVADQTLPLSYATDDGVGLVYKGTALLEAVTERPGAHAYRVERQADGSVTETVIEARVLS